MICLAYLAFLENSAPTKIISPANPHYLFYQYSQEYAHKITRPLNRDLFLPTEAGARQAFARFIAFLGDLKRYGENAIQHSAIKSYVESNEVNRVIYTLQQSLGCIADAFPDANQARKRAGTLFETLIKLIIREVGLVCEPRTIKVPLPGEDGSVMRYELDVVFSRSKIILAAETREGTLVSKAQEPLTPSPATKPTFIADDEIVGSVKTTSKDRIDKVFLDKYLLTKLLGRDIPVVAVFLHDVQRAATSSKLGKSIFGVSSTFKSGHFLGYTLALNKLDGVYYVDPRPEMRTNPLLREQIKDFQQFLVRDLWTLSSS